MHVVHKHFPSISSTNTWALEHATGLDKQAVTLVTATEQTAGRGREERSWVSPAGSNLYASYCFFLPEDFCDVANVGQLLALSCCDAASLFGINLELKWPNDLMLNGKKSGGILCETKQIENFRFVTAGVGLNINMDSAQAAAIDRPATSFCLESGAQLAIGDVLEALNALFVAALTRFYEEGFTPFLQRFKDKIPIGKEVTFKIRGTLCKGRIVGINSDGSIILEFPDGKKALFHSGELFY